MQDFLRFSHFMLLFTIMCKQTANIVVANNASQQLMLDCDQDLCNNNTLE